MIKAAYLELWQLFQQLAATLKIRAQLFKTNDVVSEWFVKIYIEWYANNAEIFC